MKLTNTTYNSGFTLIELLIAVLIIGVLAAVAVPQYQQAVLKSRYKTLMLPTKSINSGNEVYYLAHGYYADRLKELDVDFNSEDEKTLVKLSDDLEYAYVLSTRRDIDNNYIMYQKHSMNYPGEIHCEALTDDEKANKLCKLLGGEEIAGSQTSGYTTYVLEGTGNGAAPGVNGEGASCDKALSMGYTCNITKNGDSTIFKTVCYEEKTCITTEYDKNGNISKQTSCKIDSNGTCNVLLERLYDENGVTTGFRKCQKNTGDGSCSVYSGLEDQEFTYDSNGNQISAKSCAARDTTGKCTSYNYNWESVYEDGKLVSRPTCHSTKINSTTGECNGYIAISDYVYDNQGNQYELRCSIAEGKMNSSGTRCESYDDGVYVSKFNDQGDITFQRMCIQFDPVSKTCAGWESWAGISSFTYESDGTKHAIQRTCKNYNSNTDTCISYEPYITEYNYDSQNHFAGVKQGTVDSDGNYIWQSYEENIKNEEGQIIGSRSCIDLNATTGICNTWGSNTYKYLE